MIARKMELKPVHLKIQVLSMERQSANIVPNTITLVFGGRKDGELKAAFGG